MAKKRAQKALSGTLIRGADGALYFVFDDKRWAFRIPNKYTKEARALLDHEGFIAKANELPTFHGSGLARKVKGDEIRIELNRLATIGRRKPHGK
jgi:hypothetical protein